MKDRIFVSVVIGLIALTVAISVVVGVTVYNRNKLFVLDASSDEYLEEENALKAKNMYDAKDMKEEFITTAKELSNVVYSKILDGSITDEQSLKKFIEQYNKVLDTDNWENLGLEYPSKWIGKWYLDNNGFVKFKFATNTIEPEWVNDTDVQDYIVVN